MQKFTSQLAEMSIGDDDRDELSLGNYHIINPGDCKPCTGHTG